MVSRWSDGEHDIITPWFYIEIKVLVPSIYTEYAFQCQFEIYLIRLRSSSSPIIVRSAKKIMFHPWNVPNKFRKCSFRGTLLLVIEFDTENAIKRRSQPNNQCLGQTRKPRISRLVCRRSRAVKCDYPSFRTPHPDFFAPFRTSLLHTHNRIKGTIQIQHMDSVNNCYA